MSYVLQVEIRIPNSLGWQPSVRGQCDASVQGIHSGGLVRSGMEYAYLEHNMDDCSFRIQF